MIFLGQPETDYISINPAGVQDELFRIGGLGSPYLPILRYPPYPPFDTCTIASAGIGFPGPARGATLRRLAWESSAVQRRDWNGRLRGEAVQR